LVKKGQRLVSVETKDIAYFFMDGRLCYFKTAQNAKYIVDYTMDQLEASLDGQQFFRANRGFIISIGSVAQIHTYFNGKLKIDLLPDPEREVVISRDKAPDFKEWMGK
jgi:DNA-binding LytR/AlgR family response regulator